MSQKLEEIQNNTIKILKISKTNLSHQNFIKVNKTLGKQAQFKENII